MPSFKPAYQRTTTSAKQLRRDEDRQEAAERVLSQLARPGGTAVVDRREREVVRRRQKIAAGIAGLLYFLWAFVHIESGDPGSPIIPFRLWPAQAGVLKEFLLRRLLVVLKSRQVGLTWLVIAFALWRMLTIPGFSVVGLSRTEDEAKELIRRCKVILVHLPKWLAREAKEAEPGWLGPIWDAQTMVLVIQHPEGPDARFMAEQSSPNSGRSFTAMLVILDEWAFQAYAREIWQAAAPTANRQNSGQIIGLSSAEAGTLFAETFIGAMRGENDFFPIFLDWTVDPSRDDAWYERTKRMFPNTYTKEYPATWEEAFQVGARKFFPEWDGKIHTFDPDTEFPVDFDNFWCYRSLDWGFNDPFCVLYGAIDYDGALWVYRELYDNGMTAGTVADWMNDVEEGEEIHPGPADNQICEQRGNSGPTIEEEFAAAGILWEKADKNRRAGWQQIHSRLLTMIETEKEGAKARRPMLRISKACVNLIGQIEGARSDKFISDELDRNCVDHALDSLRYMSMYRPCVPKRVDPEHKIARFERYQERAERRGSWMSW